MRASMKKPRYFHQSDTTPDSQSCEHCRCQVRINSKKPRTSQTETSQSFRKLATDGVHKDANSHRSVLSQGLARIVKRILLVTQTSTSLPISTLQNAFHPQHPRPLLCSLGARGSNHLSRRASIRTIRKEPAHPALRRQHHRKSLATNNNQWYHRPNFLPLTVRHRLLLLQQLPPIPPHLPHLRRRQDRLRRHSEVRHHVRQRQRGSSGLGDRSDLWRGQQRCQRWHQPQRRAFARRHQ